jgi:hypothetical protein
MPTTLPTTFVHTINGFTKGVDRSGPFYKVIFMIDSWSDTDAFCNAIMGFGSSTGPISGITVTKNAPQQHPLSTNLYASSAVVIEGLGRPVLNANGYPDYDGGALIEVEYRAPPFDFSGSGTNFLNNQIDPATPLQWCTQEIDFSTTVYTSPSWKYRYTSGTHNGQLIDVFAKFEIPLTIMTLTFHQLPYMPMPAVRACRGRVNNATFLGSPPETVLFPGAKINREPNPDGTIVQTVALTFHERDAAHPWNSLPSADDPTFYPVEGPGGVKPYRTANLSQLLNF